MWATPLHRGLRVDRHHSLTACSTKLPTISARYITKAPHFPKPLAAVLDEGPV